MIQPLENSSLFNVQAVGQHGRGTNSNPSDYDVPISKVIRNQNSDGNRLFTQSSPFVSGSSKKRQATVMTHRSNSHRSETVAFGKTIVRMVRRIEFSLEECILCTLGVPWLRTRRVRRVLWQWENRQGEGQVYPRMFESERQPSR